MEGLVQVVAGCVTAAGLGREGGRGFLPVLRSAAVPVEGPHSYIEAVHKPRFSGKPGAEKKMGSLASQLR
jgi:hypothetical protein